MDRGQRLLGFIAYFLPVVGWIYLAIFQNQNRFARFHMRQAIGLFLFLLLTLLGWGVITWLLVWIPYAFLLGIALFALVIVAGVFSFIAWITGMANALRYREDYLPLIGGYASRLPV